MLLYLLNVLLVKSEIISICQDSSCNIECKTYSTPVCISASNNDNIFVNSSYIKRFADPLCLVPILNETQQLLNDYKCHQLNNTYYYVVNNSENALLILIPVSIVIIILAMFYCRSVEKSTESENETPMIRD